MTRVNTAQYPEPALPGPQVTGRPGPGRLIVTVYGLYAREHAGRLPVAALVALLGDVGVEEPAVRSAVSRLKRRGILVPARAGSGAGYALSEGAREILREGDRRIFEPRRAVLSEGWVLAVFSVPESERSRRHALRSQLSRLGFGTVAPGVWIAPARLRDEAERALRREGLGGYVELFRADRLPGGVGHGDDLAVRVADWWDLGRVRAGYAEFLAEFGRDGGAPPQGAGAADAFAGYVRVLTAWRRLPYLDPGLPSDVLPDDFPGPAAAELFAALRARLEEPARAHAAVRLADPSSQGRPNAS